MNVQKDHIGTRISLALEARNVRSAALAERLGVSRAAVSGWLKGGKLSLGNVTSIATVLDVSLNWLVLGTGSSDQAANAILSHQEENLLRLLRHFGNGVLEQSLGMVSAMKTGGSQPLKHFKAYDLISRTQIPIAVLDADGFLVYSNIYHNQLLGLDSNDTRLIHNRHFTEWIPRVFHRHFRSLLQETLRKGHATYKSMHICCPKTQVERKFIIHANAVSTSRGPGAHLLMKLIDNGTATA